MVLTVQAIASLFFIALGLAYGAGALALPEAAFGNPAAPKIYPLIITGFMVILSFVTLLAEIAKQKKTVASGKTAKAASFVMTDIGWLVTFVSVLCILYSIAFEKLGYVISTFIFVEAIMIYISKAKKIFWPTIIALGFSFGIYLLFSKVLAITLPPMPLLDF